MSTLTTTEDYDQSSCDSYFMSPATGETYFYLVAGEGFEPPT